MQEVLKTKKKEVEEFKAECEKFNNQDEYSKYAKMQRSLIKMEKLVKTNESEINERYQSLALSERE
jgi:hypothetical protein